MPGLVWLRPMQGGKVDAGLDGHPALADALLAPLAPDVYAHQRASGADAAQMADDLALRARRTLKRAG
jgi:hypothetical protein